MSDKGILGYYKGVAEEDALERERGEYSLSSFSGGLHVVENTEELKENEVVSVDGFLSFKGLWTKDFELVSDTNQAVDNINLALDTSLPVCDSSSEVIEYEDWDIWIAYYASFASWGKYNEEDDPDKRSYLSWATGTISTIDQGVTKILTVVKMTGKTTWTCNLGSYTGSLSYTPIKRDRLEVITDDSAEGSFVVTVKDSYKTITRTVSVNAMTWNKEPPDEEMTPGDVYLISVKNSHLFFESVRYPDWYVDTTQFYQDDDDPASKAVNGVYLVGLTDKEKVGPYVLNEAIIMTTEGEGGTVTIKCEDEETTLEKEITVTPPGIDFWIRKASSGAYAKLSTVIDEDPETIYSNDITDYGTLYTDAELIVSDDTSGDWIRTTSIYLYNFTPISKVANITQQTGEEIAYLFKGGYIDNENYMVNYTLTRYPNVTDPLKVFEGKLDGVDFYKEFAYPEFLVWTAYYLKFGTGIPI